MSHITLITGAGRGLGASLAEKLSQKGYQTILHYYKSREGAQETAEKIRSQGGTAYIVQADLTQPEGCSELISKVKETPGSLDVLVNNSGVYHEKEIHSLTEKEWFEGIHTTASAVFFTTRACLPLLRQSSCGRVINIGDSSCERPGARNLSVSYHIGKTGVYMLTRSFAQAEPAATVTFNMVSPGYLDNSVGLPDPEIIPAGRFGTFDDIFNAVQFLIRPESEYITGTNIVCSGGWNLR